MQVIERVATLALTDPLGATTHWTDGMMAEANGMSLVGLDFPSAAANRQTMCGAARRRRHFRKPRGDVHVFLTKYRDNAYRSAPVAQIQRNAERGALLDGETAWHEMQLG
jgi:hypothetical protein